MSSILEALKKLEAEKNLQPISVEEPYPTYPDAYPDGGLFGRYPDPAPRPHRTSSVTLVLAGGIFAVLLIGVSVMLMTLVLDRGQPVAARPQLPEAPLAVAVVPVPELEMEPEASVEPPDTPVEPERALETVSLSTDPDYTPPAPVRVKAAAPPALERPEPAAPPVERVEVASLLPASTEVRYERYIPEPAPEPARSSPALPEDIRRLPMLSRSERTQYRLDEVKINMLNEKNALRPLGNAIINLEKVFVGETLPGTNAVLKDVQNHGIAVEILSTRQQYYIPR